MKRFGIIRGLAREACAALHLSIDFYHGMSHGWAHDLVDMATEKLKARFDAKRANGSESETEFMKLARSRNYKKAMAAVARIEKDANLLGLVEDGSVLRAVRIMATSRIRHQGTLIALALGLRDVDIALEAVRGINDQGGLGIIMRESLYVSVRRKAAKLCCDEDALLRASALASDEDVRWIASIRYAELSMREQRELDLAMKKSEPPPEGFPN